MGAVWVRVRLSTYAVAGVVLAWALGVGPITAGPTPEGPATPSGETTPVDHSGDAADDPAIWVHPTDPARSLVIGNDKGGALEVYDLSGRRIQRIAGDVFVGNVDVYQDFRIGRGKVDLVGVVRAGMTFYQLDPTTRRLTNITEGGSRAIGVPGEGFCLYRSPVTRKLYAFVVGRDGRVEQHKVGDRDWDGLVDSYLVREFDVGSEAEGCVADPATGRIYLSEEHVGIWRYGAEPTDSATDRVLVDSVTNSGGRDGHLVADVEGLTLVRRPDGTGYLIASAQNVSSPDDSYFTVYRRGGGNSFVRDFRVETGAVADGCSRTDGIAAYAGDLGPRFPYGLFVCQDNDNTAPRPTGNQNFKLVSLETVVDL